MMDDLGYERSALSGASPDLTELANETLEEAKRTYRRVRQDTMDKAVAVDTFVRERPYAALGLGVLAGLVIAQLFLSHGPKVIYVKPRRSQV
jgi:ElaB/YqjD/DUF883 family membrane-anchored ribosome-binding protein